MDIGAGPGAASAKEALCGQGETSGGWSGPGRVGARAGEALGGLRARWAVLPEEAKQRRSWDEHPAADPAHGKLASVRRLVRQCSGDTESTGGLGQRVGETTIVRDGAGVLGRDGAGPLLVQHVAAPSVCCMAPEVLEHLPSCRV